MSWESTPREVLAPAERLEAARSEINRLRAALTDTAAERDRLEKENREFHNNWVNACDALNVVEAERDRLRADVERLQVELRVAYKLPLAMGHPVAVELEAIRAEKAELVAALEIIAGRKQCIDNLMSNGDIARAALAKATATEGDTR